MLNSYYVNNPQSLEMMKSEQTKLLIQDELKKAKALAQFEKKEKSGSKAMRYSVPMNYNMNASTDNRIHSTVPFSYLRRMATNYPIARACINRRIRQMTQLDWEITTVNEIENEIGYENTIKAVSQMFKSPMGFKTRFRELINILVDDTLTLDCISFEYQKNRGGELLNLVPVDPATIVLRVDEQGGTPLPPEVAYAQYIGGQKIAEFTTDEMLYETYSARSYSPYGLAPLESLILQVESALRGTMYNLAYFKESNVPEGFITLPEEIANSQEEIRQWQEWFDLLMAGDIRFQRRLKILPGGSDYQAAKKPEDMAFERFEMWMLQQTCAVFDVQPQDIGITYQVNKATGEVQQEVGKERGLYPLAGYIKEIFDSIIQEELELTELQFVWIDLNPTNAKDEIDVAEREIRIGALSVDEYRQEHGREPIGLGHAIYTGTGVQLVEDVLTGESEFEEEKEDKEMDEDLRRWRKCVYNDLAKGKPIRTRFKSDFIDKETHDEISRSLKGVHSKLQAKYLFDQYLDEEIKTSMKLLKVASKMREVENASI